MKTNRNMKQILSVIALLTIISGCQVQDASSEGPATSSDRGMGSSVSTQTRDEIAYIPTRAIAQSQDLGPK